MKNEELICNYHETGDIEIRNKVIENNMALVKHVASKFYSSKYYE